MHGVLHLNLTKNRQPYSAAYIRGLAPAAWFRQGVGITVTGSGVSTWADQSGNGRDLLQGTDTNRPALQADGSVLFDGVDNYMKTGAFTLNQPTTIYLLAKQVAWNVAAYLFDGNAANSMAGLQRQAGGGGSSPAITQFAGTYGGQDLTHMTVGAFHTLAMVFNGASSSVQVDLNTAGTGDAGASNAGALTIATSGDALQQAGSVHIREIIVFGVAHSADQRYPIQQYLAKLGGITI